MTHILRAAKIALWVLAIFVALASSRYFFLSQETLRAPRRFVTTPEAAAGAALGANARREFPLLFLPHVGGGIVALVAGLFQFRTKLRIERPKVHRRIGITYAIAVAISATAGLPLSLLIPRLVPQTLSADFLPMSASFFVLSIVWFIATAIAFLRARSRRFLEHREWMMRSYSLTFAAVSVRLVAAALTFATGDVVFAVNSGVLSWPLNLIVTEYLIRRTPQPALA